MERSQNTGKICSYSAYCNDNVTRTTTWNGKIGLMSPSDYGFPTSDGPSTKREVCLSTELYNWRAISSECYNNNWLYKSTEIRRNMIPCAIASAKDTAFNIYNDNGAVSGYDAIRKAYAIVPTLFLKSNIKITSGNDTYETPYTLKAK